MAKYQKIDDGYIGRGAFGSVSRVRRISDGQIVACKTIQFFNNQVKKSAVRDECEILETLQHPNIVRFYDVQWDAFQARLYMENCEGGNLDQFVGKHHGEENWPSEKDVWRVTFQLAAAIAYCHEGILRKPAGGFYTDVDPGPWRTIWHRDIKPENVFVRQYPDGEIAVKLGDFGLGVILFDEHEKYSYGGTNQYIPPEVTRTSPSWSNKSDIFAFGCTLHFLCVGNPPFGSHLTMVAQSTAGQLEFPNRFSDNLRRRIHSCFAYLPADRPEAREVFKEAEGHVDNRDLQRVTLSPAGTILGDGLPTALLPKGPDKRDAQIPSPGPTAKDLEYDRAIQIQLSNGISTINLDPSMKGKSKELSGNHDVEHRISRRPSDLPVATSKSELAPPSISHSAPSHQGDSSTPPTMVPAKVSADTYFQIPKSEELNPAQRTSSLPDPSPPLSSSRSKSTGTSYIMDFSHENFEKALIRNLGAFICGLPNRYPHFSVFYDLSDKAGQTRAIHAETLTRAVAVSDSIEEEVQDAPVSTKSRSLFGLRKKSEKSESFKTTSIRLEASQCNEYLLLNNEEWISNSRTWGSTDISVETVIWLKSKLISSKKVYLIMGYLTYMDPKVSKENDSRTGSHNSSYATLSVPTGEAATVGSPSQQSSVSGRSLSTGQNLLEMDGERVQAGFFREVTLPSTLARITSYNVRGEIMLGDPITVYFWGPRKRPL